MTKMRKFEDIEEKKCIYCGKKFIRRKYPHTLRHGGKHKKPVRRYNSITCSPECSRAYNHYPEKFRKYYLKKKEGNNATYST